jgi:hypothetical protein
MANESAMRERGWPEPRRQQYHNHAGENHRIGARDLESIDWKMRFDAKLTAGQAAGRSPDSALRGQSNSVGRKSRSGCAIDALRIPEKLGETPGVGRSGTNRGASNCALKIPRVLLSY